MPFEEPVVVSEPVKSEVVETPLKKTPEVERVEIKQEQVEATPVLPEIGLEQVPVEEKEAVVPSPFEALNEPISKLLEIKTVKGAFILSRDGLLIQNYYQGRSDLEELGALIANVFNEANEAFKFLKTGSLEKCIIEKRDETVCVITAGESLLCIITMPEAKPGLVFVYARKLIEEIRKILG